nr:oleoyl-acyl carrier protein thioesterase, chloroplastic-like [Tanacetum cinerariifolium]
MRKLHLILVYARIHIEVHNYPAWSDMIEIESWIQGQGNIGVRRNWIIKDCANNGDVIGRATRLAFPEESVRKIAKLEDPAEYSRLGLSSIPQEIIDAHELQAITLDFKHECKQGGIVDSFTSRNPLDDLTNSNSSSATKKDGEDLTRFIHLLRSADNGLEISRCRTVWRMKPAKG